MATIEGAKKSRRQAINVPGLAPAPLGTYSHAVKAGDFVFLAGQGARDAVSGQEVGITCDTEGNVTSYDIEAQTHAVIKNLESVLAACQLTLKDLVDVNVFLADMSDFQAFNKIYAEYFSFDEPPVRTTIEAARLPGKNYIEIKAVAICNSA